jgi:hypothetical protein
MVAAEAEELHSYELGAIVGDDRVGDPKAMNDIHEECDHLLGSNVVEGPDLNPLGEFVDGDHQVREVPVCLLQRTNEIQSQNHQWPRYWDHLKGLCWHMCLLHVELAASARQHNLDSIRYCNRLVKPLPKGVAHEGPGRRVVLASP